MQRLIFLPGASGSTEFWNPIIECLGAEENSRIVGYPAFGEIPPQADVHDFSSLCDYVLGQIDEECIVIAQSMGGIFAVEATLQKPDLVKGLVLIATSGGIDLSPFHVEDWRSAYASQYLNYPDWFVHAHADFSPELDQLKQRVLLLWGGADPISPPAVGEYLETEIPASELKIIQGGDHGLAATHAAEAAAYISAYLQAI